MPSTALTLLTAPLPENKRLVNYLLCTVLLLLTAAVHAAPALTLNSQQSSISLENFSDIIEDTDKLYRIDDILAPALERQFRPAESGDFNLSHTIGRYWFRFKLSNTSSEITQQLLQIMPIDLNTAQLFTQSGRQIAPMVTTELIRNETLFSIPVHANTTSTYYLALEYPFDRQLELTLHNYTSFLGEVSQREFSNSIFWGVLGLLCIYSLISASLHSDSLFLATAGFAFLIICSQSIAWGYIGSPQGLLPPWDGYSLICIILAISIIDLIYALRFPIFPISNPGHGPKVIHLTAIANIIAVVISVIAGAEIAAITINLIIPFNSLILLFIGLNGFLQTYSRLLFYYMVARTALALIVILTVVGYSLSLITTSIANIILLLLATTICTTHTALLIARQTIRQRKQNQDEQRIAILGAVNRAKTDILARITHDIRTPMSAMLGVSELLQDTRLTASQEDHIRTLQRSGHELLQLLQEASQATRFNENDIELRNELINLPEIIDESVSSFRNIAAEQALELICDIDSEVSEKLIGDPSRIRQLLTHVMNNAFEHFESGYILLNVSPSDINQGLLNFEVSHRGKPFSNLEKQAINGSVSEEGGIINTRLAIASQLITLMNGNAAVRSSGKGLHSLRFTLQLGVPNNSDNNTLRIRTGLLNNKRLLVVDSNQTFCKVVSKQCSNWGMPVFIASSDNAAIATVRNQSLINAPVDIILIDHALPGGGLKLAKRIYDETKDQQQPPIGLLLAHANITFDRDELRDAGVRRILSKPLTGVALRSALLSECHFDANAVTHTPDQYRTDALTLSSLQCLIAEDNPTNAQVLTRMLKSLGITVHHVENGQQAVNTFMRKRFDVVIMDIEMPIMDGAEATRQIRQFEKEEERERTPIIGLTANALDEQRDSYLRAGMDLHLVKPIRLWELAEAIKRWTGYQQNKS
ncbi:response regulator [Zhongshania aliphaticivorans]|uniref:response regulator n=1 Tax=Zhongshania aliphaticivorans TaxID=1470434 RepID=UPI0012E45C5B|nr:response regulator [Zhongshania aliphaticivorans]CAA0097212.1 Signal transduction histidine-protein kinase BarA [Zhongshania aliphaticivorans]